MEITINDIYDQLKFYHLDDDAQQELALKIWEAKDSYDSEKGQFNTWTTKIVNNYLISISRSTQFKEDKRTDAFSKFDNTEVNNTINPVVDALTSNEPSPLDSMIASQDREELLERLNHLGDKHKDILLDYISGDYDGSTSANRTKLKRAKDALVNFKPSKYELVNLETKKVYVIKSLDEARAITGISVEGIRVAFKQSRSFSKKKWKLNRI